MDDLYKFNEKGNEEKSEAPSTPHRASITIDYALYEHYLEGSDLSEKQKRELLDALWSVIVSFVDLGFQIHPLQQTHDPCEQNENSDEDVFQSVQQMVDCKTQGDEKDGHQNRANSVPKFEP